MAASIETHVSEELHKLGQIVLAVKNFSELDVATTLDQYSMVAGFLGDCLHDQFEVVHALFLKDVLPFFVAIKSTKLS